MSVLRIAVALLAVVGNFCIPVIDNDDDTLAVWLFTGGSVLLGLVIGRWWAICIAFSWLAVSTTVSPGHDDTQGTVFFLVGILSCLTQAVLIATGVTLAKIAKAVRRSRASGSH